MSESEIARRKVFVVEIPTEVWVELRTEITLTDDAQAVFNRATDKVEGVMEECGLVRMGGQGESVR